MAGYTQKMVTGVLSVVISSFVAAIFAYLLRLVLAQKLSPENFGLTYAVIAVFGLVAVFAHLGFNETISKYVSEFNARKQKEKIKFSITFALLTQLSVALIVGVILYFSSGFLAANYFKNPAAEMMVKIFLISFVLAPFEFVTLSSFQGFQKMGLYSVAAVIRPAALFSLTWIFLGMNLGLMSYVLALAAVSIIPFFTYVPIFIKKVFPEFLKIKSHYDSQLAKKLRNFAISVIITASASIVISYTDTILITFFKTLKEVAYYNVAIPTAQVLWLFSVSITAVLLPISSELWAKNRKFLAEGVKSIYKFASIIIFPAALAMLFFSDFIIVLLFGPEYQPASLPLKILALGSIFLTIAQVGITLMNGIGKPRYNNYTVWTAALCNLVLNIFLVPKFGIAGAAFASAFSFFLMMVISYIMVRKLTDIKINFADILKVIFCSAFFVAILYLFRGLGIENVWLKAIISLISAGLFYAVLLLITKTITLKEIRTIFERAFAKKTATYNPIQEQE